MPSNAVEESNWNYESVPSSAVKLYKMIWQFETWLRTMVYVELRAAQVDWEEVIKRYAQGWPPRSLENDKKLYHMATHHQANISYLTFGELWKVISDEKYWLLFAPYFPPKDNTFARIEEVKQIRNRVAHFREPHQNDVDRLSLFLRDMEAGIRRFCIRYTVGKGVADPADDPVSERLAEMWPNHVGYGIELHRPNNDWLYAPPPRRHNPYMNAELSLLTHRNYTRGSTIGTIYGLELIANLDKQFSTKQFFLRTEQLHEKIIHIFIDSRQMGISVTIPAIRGFDETAKIIAELLDAGRNCARSFGSENFSEERRTWPEYVLWPDHMLTFFDPNMPDPVLDVAG